LNIGLQRPNFYQRIRFIGQTIFNDFNVNPKILHRPDFKIRAQHRLQFGGLILICGG
jgi:hypothetical protein